MDIIRSRVIPLQMDNIDTDMIIPAEYLKRTDKAGLKEGLFAQLRTADPGFPLEQEEYARASIIVAGENFGCGSSREHAVWALLDRGIRAVIAVSFADIFQQNALKNGLLPIELPRKAIDEIVTAGAEDAEVSLARRSVRIAGCEYSFPIDPFHCNLLLNNMDDLDYLVSKLRLIRAFHRGRSKTLFIETGAL